MAEIISFRTACQLSKKFRSEGKKVIWTSGCFDILHIGHIEFFNKVRRWSGTDCMLFVGLDSDKYIKTRKDRLSFFSQLQRTKVVSSLSIVDYVVPLPYFEHKFENFVRRYSLLNPNFVVFGNTEQVRIQRIKKQTQKAGVLFRHLAIKSRLSSTSHIAQILHKYFPS